MAIDHQKRNAKRRFPSQQPLYRYWEHLKKRCDRQGIPLQQAWRDSYAAFAAAVGDPPVPGKYRLVLINPARGFVWYNVRWLPTKRALAPERLRWLSYRGQRDEAWTWAKRFGIPLSDMERRLDSGWTLRRLDHHGRRLKAERERRKRRLAQAGVTVPNPEATDTLSE